MLRLTPGRRPPNPSTQQLLSHPPRHNATPTAAPPLHAHVPEREILSFVSDPSVDGQLTTDRVSHGDSSNTEHFFAQDGPKPLKPSMSTPHIPEQREAEPAPDRTILTSPNLDIPRVINYNSQTTGNVISAPNYGEGKLDLNRSQRHSHTNLGIINQFFEDSNVSHPLISF